ncbi:MAG: PQQ-dependent sugar dehydrogenase [Leadbetterella sp.]
MKFFYPLFGIFLFCKSYSQTTETRGLNYKRFSGIGGTSISDLTSSSKYPKSPDQYNVISSFETSSDIANEFGARIYGYLVAPSTGNYTFWISGDDNVELYLSTDNNPNNKRRIAYHSTYTNSREWNKVSTQKSSQISLTANVVYFIEAFQKEGSGGDHLAVGWAKPGQATTSPSEVIPNSALKISHNDNIPPFVPTEIVSSNIGQTTVKFTWEMPSDNFDVCSYDLFQNGNKINTSAITSVSYTVTGLKPGKRYAFTISSRDPAGNMSSQNESTRITTSLPTNGGEQFSQRTIMANQSMPHELVLAPDNNLWFIERFSGKVSFTNPNVARPVKTTVLTLGSKMVRGGGQDGLFGLALHPDFAQNKPFVYLAYTYESTSATIRKTRIERYTFNSNNNTLGSPVTILENIPGSNDHNAGRLCIGPDKFLFYTVGDMGAGQFDNSGRDNNSQNLNSLEGKILRFNSELVNGSWIPNSNPYSTNGAKNAIFSLGHRNAQGLVWGNVYGEKYLYSSEHGPYSDDEINIIQSAKNYGWPLVVGYADGNYNGRTVGGNTISNEQTNGTNIGHKGPIHSLFASISPPSQDDNYMTWPSVAPSGMDFYGYKDGIPGWNYSLLIAQLKKGAVCRLKLSDDGKTITSDTIQYFRGKGRFRDVAVSSDGLKIYVACDSSGQTSGPTGDVVNSPSNPGSILEFTYVMPTSGRLAYSEDPINKPLSPTPKEFKGQVEYNVQEHGLGEGSFVHMVDLQGNFIASQVVSSDIVTFDIKNVPSGEYELKAHTKRGKLVDVKRIRVSN